jgi:hypothetical protein
MASSQVCHWFNSHPDALTYAHFRTHEEQDMNILPPNNNPCDLIKVIIDIITRR